MTWAGEGNGSVNTLLVMQAKASSLNASTSPQHSHKSPDVGCSLVTPALAGKKMQMLWLAGAVSVRFCEKVHLKKKKKAWNMLWFSYIPIQWVSSCPPPASPTLTLNLFKKKILIFWIVLLPELSNPPKIQPQPPTFLCDKSQMYTHIKTISQTNKLQGVFIPRERFVFHEVSAELAVVLGSHPGEMGCTKEKAGGHKPEPGRAC